MSDRETASSIAADVATGRRRAAEVCRAALRRIERRDPAIHAFLEVTGERALEQAGRVDADVAAGRLVGALAGVPIAVKDNICTAFGHTTCASRMLAGYMSPYSATVVERIEAAGGVIVGKTNLDEFAMGSSTESGAAGPTVNPWAADRVPGGSSGGSAAAVASGMVPLALGSDTGGSIRQPAALCGVVGLKPTYGRVSRYGLVAYGSSLDQIGPLAATVGDAALLLSVIGSHDARDATSVKESLPALGPSLDDRTLSSLARRPRVGVVREHLAEGLDGQTRAALETALEVYRGLGATIVEVTLPRSPRAIAAYYLVAMAECSSNLARFDGVRYGHRSAQCEDIVELYSASRAEGFGPEVKRRIMLGTYALSAGYYEQFYEKALRVRQLVKDDLDRALATCDVLVGPTSPTPAFKLGEKVDDPLAMYLSDAYTVEASLAGLPAISIPCGFTADGLPIGLQLTGPAFGERLLLQAARLYERETGWHARRAWREEAAGGSVAP